MTNDWKPTENNISSPWDVNVQENNIGEPLKTGVVDWDALSLRIEQPKVICRCDLFGQQQLVISFYDTEVKTLPIPNRWIRFWTQETRERVMDKVSIIMEQMNAEVVCGDVEPIVVSGDLGG